MTDTFAHLSLPRAGEKANGDAVFLRQRGPSAMFAVIDALGHGAEAAAVAQRAVELLTAVPEEQRIAEVIATLHAGLRHSRGAAATICRRSGRTIEGCGVGNVMLRAEGIRMPFLLNPGVLGVRLRRSQTFTGQLNGNARLVLCSDGIAPSFALAPLSVMPVEEACSHLMDTLRRPYDDATVLIADLEDPRAL